MTNKSSFMLAVLLIANPFMLLFFQNCSGITHISAQAGRVPASVSTSSQPAIQKVENIDQKSQTH